MNLRHIKRTDHCLNCNEQLNPVKDNFCPHCGQVNNTRKETAFGLVRELVEEFLHFDSKASNSLIPLLIKPGKLTDDYNSGKRARYFHPVRLFLTVTVIMFLVISIFSKEKKQVVLNENGQYKKTVVDADSVTADSTEDFSIKDSLLFGEKPETDFEWDFGGKSKAIHNDSIVALIKSGVTEPEAIMDSLHIEKSLLNKFLVTQVVKNSATSWKEVQEYYKHRLPWIIFSLMPVFAFAMFLLYFRKNKYYVDHLIFGFHLHTAIFLLYSIVTLLIGITGWEWFDYIVFFVPVYYFMALKTVYKQSWAKTILKGMIGGIIYLVLGTITFVSVIILLYLVY